MGAVGSIVSRAMRNWNVEARAHKVISQPKPKPAPTYKATQKQIELVNKLEPDYQIKAQKKDHQLDDYLKKVYVTSNNSEIAEIDQRSNPERPLPKDRYLHEGFQYGFYEPPEIRPGRVSLRQALEFLANHKNDPEKYSVEYIAAEYKLDKQLVENILEHYTLFNVYDTQEDHNKDVIASHIPVSQRTSIRVKYQEDKREIEEDKKRFIQMTNTPKSIDDK